MWRGDDPGVAPGMRADAEHGDASILSSAAQPKAMALTAAASSAEGRSPHPSVQGARIAAMRSPLVVTSWWSNSLGLTCLHRLAKRPLRRPIYLIQAGKSAEQKARFRAGMPPGVIELAYPDELPADDSKMREYLALALLRELPGAWFIDHDAFFHEDPEPWFSLADDWFGANALCLCIGEPRNGPGITQPAYWISPGRWPQGISSFDPVPFREKPHVRRPDLSRTDGDLVQPLKDTLVQAREELAAHGLSGWFPLTLEAAARHTLPPFPSHTHLGGLHAYTNPTPSGARTTGRPRRWLRSTHSLRRVRPRGWLPKTRNYCDDTPSSRQLFMPRAAPRRMGMASRSAVSGRRSASPGQPGVFPDNRGRTLHDDTHADARGSL